MWTFVQTTYRLAISCFFGLPGASALVILFRAIEVVADPWLGTDRNIDEITRADEITSFVENLIEAIVLSPYAILIHRRIILHDMAGSYLTAATSARFVRFVGAALLFVFADVLGGRALALSQSSHWSFLIGIICAIVFVILFLRVFLAFPAIATDGSSTPFSDSFRDTRGSSWWLFFLLILTAIPIVLFGIGLGRSLGDPSEYTGLWWLSMFVTAVLNAFWYVVIVALASYLYAKRSEWRAISGPAARTRLIFRVIAILVVASAAYYVIHWVPSSLPLFFFFVGGPGSSFSAYIALQILALFTLRKSLRLWASVPLPFMLVVAFITVQAYWHQSNIWPLVMIFASPWAVLWVAATEVFGLWDQTHPGRWVLTLLTLAIGVAPLAAMLGMYGPAAPLGMYGPR